MATSVNIHEAKTHLSKLFGRVRLGQEVVIAEADGPVARLVPEALRSKARQLGTGKGEIVTHDPFYDDLPDELLDLLEGKGDEPYRVS